LQGKQIQIQTIGGVVTFAMIITIKYSKDDYLVTIFNSEHLMTLKRSLPGFLSAF